MSVLTDHRTPAEIRGRNPDALVIALVNLMPDAALECAERQYRDLLGAASGKRKVVMKLFTLSEIERGESAMARIRSCYEPLDALWHGGYDALIVTSTEARAAALFEEPYWESLTKLVQWAEDHTTSAIWSGLAAHATVQYLDGIERRRLRDKLSGVFGCKKASDHALLEGLRSRWLVPHCRCFDLPEAELVTRGYEVLSKAPDVGVDMFMKQRKRSLFLFLQGHPEFDARALFREFRRDSLRFLNRERLDFPQMPRGYFDDRSVMILEGIRERALQHRDPELILDFSAAEARGQFLHAWRESSIQIYANWFAALAARRARDSQRERTTRTSPMRVRLNQQISAGVSAALNVALDPNLLGRTDPWGGARPDLSSSTY
ncbi:MAG: homoserine O-succinyltransferase [Burkholderiaceae bacterium]|jgi:homoserine O-succinyltransferase